MTAENDPPGSITLNGVTPKGVMKVLSKSSSDPQRKERIEEKVSVLISIKNILGDQRLKSLLQARRRSKAVPLTHTLREEFIRTALRQSL